MRNVCYDTSAAEYRSQSLLGLYFWRSTVARAGRCNIFQAQISERGEGGEERIKRSPSFSEIEESKYIKFSENKELSSALSSLV